jgi:hypothetical protein
MKKLLLFGFVGLIGLAFTLAAQDLGELSKKEKAKRQAQQEQGKTPKVLTNDDIEKMNASQDTEQSPDQTPSSEDPGLTEDETAAGGADQDLSADISGGIDEVAGSEVAEEETPGPSVDEQLKQLQEQKEAAEAQDKSAQEAIDNGGLLHTYAVGNQFRASRQAQKEISGIDKQQKQLEQKKNSQEASKPQPAENPKDEQSDDSSDDEPPQ